MKVKLSKDKIITLSGGRALVGVFAQIKCENCQCDTEALLAEVSPKVAERLVKNWNKK